ncbi:zinc finger and BTB domain-containing protein 37-like [Neodiprion virginianus]|uniref:zinc finger and BTB domain-containing protein 37-like n=1 Tax=Neodiprion virginianus TaxID=2961670 RepID=UPI001EE73453|nr:zinc finger and BTB domain-containing protein 37-like [Neodiprion virginianus]XP_046605575.1 zinc finger and BTB domain-containing protein 37-like [Neodiprion virginianus]XP_046605576.1 zinc finger and BTB domain-containing protein 37-like [Neodiprion virginianus]
MSGEQFSLVWNSFPANLSSGLYTLLSDEQLVDVTLAAEGQMLRAHKLILSLCSTYFKELFKMNSCKHPIVILKDVNYRDLSALLHFIYQGEVHVRQEDLGNFLKVAETLQIKGLTKDKSEEDGNSVTINNISRSELGENLREQSKELESMLETVRKSERNSLDHEKSMITAREGVSPVAEAREMTSLSQDTISPASTKSVHNKFSDQERNIEPDSIICDILSTKDDDLNRMENNASDEQLHHTSEVADLLRTKDEFVDYTSDISCNIVCKREYDSQENLDDGNSNLRAQDNLAANAFSQLEEAFSADFSTTGGDFSQGRQTMGAPGSSVPLETILRVVSELEPTIRAVRGKVICMYSCPWCMRHFSQRGNLKIHVRYVHGPLESLTCKLCGNTYKNSNSLRVHSYVHRNAKRNKQ